MIGSLNLLQTQWARNVVQVSAAVSGEERCVMRQTTAAWETTLTVFQKLTAFHLLMTQDNLFGKV